MCIINYKHITGSKWQASTTPTDTKQIYFSRISKPVQRLLLTLKTMDDSDEDALIRVESKARRELKRVVMVFSTTNVYVERKLGRERKSVKRYRGLEKWITKRDGA